MPRTVDFGSAEVESGKNKGTARTISFRTSIKPENNTSGLPVEKGHVSVVFSPSVPQVFEFTSADEVRQYAGAHLDTFLVDAANSIARARVRAALTTEFRKLELAPSDVAGFVAGIVSGITAEGLFEPVTRGASGPRGIKAELAGLEAAAAGMTKDELIAAIGRLTIK